MVSDVSDPERLRNSQPARGMYVGKVSSQVSDVESGGVPQRILRGLFRLGVGAFAIVATMVRSSSLVALPLRSIDVSLPIRTYVPSRTRGWSGKKKKSLHDCDNTRWGGLIGRR